MDRHRLWAQSPLFIIGLGVGLFFIAVGHHTRELLALNRAIGPIVALVLDGLPALGLIYGGYWLSQTESAPEDRRRVVVWSLAGGLIFLAVNGATFLVRIIEGRVITEPMFPLLIAIETGAIAGLIAGYYSAQARADARHARVVTDALAFVNNLIRHDLRNDLNVIQGHASLVDTQQSTTDDDPQRDASAVIAEKADEALTRISTTRAITNILVGEPDLDPTDLASITADLTTQMEATYSVTITTDLPDCALVTANAGLRSVVDNLLENAIEHNDTDNPRIAVAVETDANSVRLIVSDNGPGIPETQKKTLFDANGAETDGGGLILVQTLVEGYNGTIRVEDNEPRGSTFVVELPRANEQR
jgi:signal transduction histidine kinase